MKFRIYVVAVFCIIYVAGASAAPIENPGFEHGTLLGWDSSGTGTGTASVVGAYEGIPLKDFIPVSVLNGGVRTTYEETEGDYFALLEATSTISQLFDYTDGMVLGFDWNFIAEDEIQYANDYAFYSVSSDPFILNTTSIDRLADIHTFGDYKATGWEREEYLFSGVGSAWLTFGVVNDPDDDEGNSKLLVDNITLTEASVPEPSVIALFSIGLLGLGFAGRRRKV
ncbi:MAG: PEP-CTERM sorting domain-containing protein [Gammaproteobacteria bacterium]|nr:PEP-CTERM sorting domain-containing protein [Gammaproteobacteria bacterium]